MYVQLHPLRFEFVCGPTVQIIFGTMYIDKVALKCNRLRGQSGGSNSDITRNDPIGPSRFIGSLNKYPTALPFSFKLDFFMNTVLSLLACIT